MPSLSKALNYLFVSKVRIKSLKYFFENPDTPIHLRAVSRELREEINAVRRELMRLTEIKFLKAATRGNKKYFSLNEEFPYLEELQGMFFKSYGLGESIIKNHNKLGVLYYAGLTSNYIKRVKLNQQDIDLVIVGDIDMSMLDALVKNEEIRIGREIHYTVLNLGEFNLRKKRKDPFLLGLLLSTQIMLIGNREEYST